ncbi:MAG: type II toxin-antitoxin system RelE/ParE family toxin [Phycisphaerae bacterium]|nr:type II toxin-antitoxin system RelE/ParE family toxin [Saprospiraceae bacterium]
MARKLSWDKEVLVQIDEVATYVSENWGKAAAAKFIKTTQKQAKLLINLPHLGRKSSKADDLYLINVGTYHWLYYLVFPDQITVVYLFDTRQEPEKNSYQ